MDVSHSLHKRHTLGCIMMHLHLTCAFALLHQIIFVSIGRIWSCFMQKTAAPLLMVLLRAKDRCITSHGHMALLPPEGQGCVAVDQATTANTALIELCWRPAGVSNRCRCIWSIEYYTISCNRSLK
jgi:hypothetical protein